MYEPFGKEESYRTDWPTDSLAPDREVGRVVAPAAVAPMEARLDQVHGVHHRHLADVQVVRLLHLEKIFILLSRFARFLFRVEFPIQFVMPLVLGFRAGS